MLQFFYVMFILIPDTCLLNKYGCIKAWWGEFCFLSKLKLSGFMGTLKWNTLSTYVDVSSERLIATVFVQIQTTLLRLFAITQHNRHRYILRVQYEIVFSWSIVMRPGEIFDLEWLDNHPWLSPDFHLHSALPWKLHKQPTTLELIRVITTLPTKRNTSPDVGFRLYSCCCCCFCAWSCCTVFLSLFADVMSWYQNFIKQRGRQSYEISDQITCSVVQRVMKSVAVPLSDEYRGQVKTKTPRL